jgi:hypothetical protein
MIEINILSVQFVNYKVLSYLINICVLIYFIQKKYENSHYQILLYIIKQFYKIYSATLY